MEAAPTATNPGTFNYCHECAPLVGADHIRAGMDDGQATCHFCGKSNYSVRFCFQITNPA